MHQFIQALRFIGRDGQIPGSPPLPTLLHLTIKTVEISALALVIAMLIALPIGIWLGHIHRGSFVAINLGNIWRALPSLAVLAIGVAFLGIGLSNVLLALVVLAVPPMITNSYVAIDGVDSDLVDAGRGMGMTEREILLRIELPLGIPLIFAGIRTSALFVVSTTTISALTGFSGSLGDVIANETSYHLAGVVGAAMCIAALALAIEMLLALAQRALTPRGIKLSSSDESLNAITPLVTEA